MENLNEQQGLEFKRTQPEEVKTEQPVVIDLTVTDQSTDVPTTVLHDFERGELIIPNDDIHNAFFFDEFMDLNPDVEYRRATSAEYTFYNKNIINGRIEVKGFDKYKNDNMKRGHEAVARIDKERTNFNF